MTDETIAILKVKELRQIVREEFQALTRKEPETDISERMTRRQAAKFMQVSYQTIYNYKRAGIVIEHGTTGKKFFLRSELIQAMKNNDGKIY